MAGDYYGNTGGSAKGASTEGDEGMAGGDESQRSDTGMGETTLVPKSMFQGKDLKPGDEFYFTVVGVHENEVEVAYKMGDEKDSESPEAAFDKSFPGGGESMMGGE